MKIKNQDLVNMLDNKAIENGKDNLTLFSAIATGLLTTQTAAPETSYKIAFKVMNAKEAELTSEEITHIKSVFRECKGWAPLITGQVIELLA